MSNTENKQSAVRKDIYRA